MLVVIARKISSHFRRLTSSQCCEVDHPSNCQNSKCYEFFQDFPNYLAGEKTMNLRQAQRSLAELVSKCEAAHIQLPEVCKQILALTFQEHDTCCFTSQKDPLEARAEAVEAIIHSLKDGKANLGDAQDELQQKFGLELAWKQHMENEEAKRQRRRQPRSKNPRLSNLGFVAEIPGDTASSSNGEHQQSTQGRKLTTAKGGAMTPSKRPAANQEGPPRQTASMKIAKKVKNARELIAAGGPSEVEEKQSPSEAKPAAGLGNILDDDDTSRSPDQGIAELLDLEDLGEVEEGGSEMSSDEEFAL